MNRHYEMRTVIALLTARHHLGAGEVAEMIYALPLSVAQLTLGNAIGSLYHELELGCADAGLDLGEYLQSVGLAAADL